MNMEEITVAGARIILISKDGYSFQVSTAVANMSRFVKRKMIMAHDDTRTSTRSNEEVHNPRKQKKIFVPTAKGEVLEKVLKYCEHYARDPMTDLSVLPMAQSTNDHKNKLADLGLQEWYVSFIDVEQPVLDRLYLVARYMDIEPLLYLTMAAIRVFVSNNPGSQWMLGSYEE